MQLELDVGPKRRGAAGQAAKEVGMARAAANAGPDWYAEALDVNGKPIYWPAESERTHGHPVRVYRAARR